MRQFTRLPEPSRSPDTWEGSRHGPTAFASAPFIPPQQPLERLAIHGLTKREAEVAYWIAQGRRDREIAQSLGISLRTAEHHVSSILQKLDAESRTAIASFALQLLFAPPASPTAERLKRRSKKKCQKWVLVPMRPVQQPDSIGTVLATDSDAIEQHRRRK